MNRRDKKKRGKHEHPLPGQIPPEEKQEHIQAFRQAEADISQDADLSANNPNEDLDEGESARLGEKPKGI
ncbi:MAG TPA: hypothetical protein VEB63_08475 [Chitinophagaceae bacterium]|nr:hypothetical protein [Chitinophagaceae bacterium]